MKVHYINISLFALPLNILVYNQRNHNNTTLNTQTKRSLCECELFEPANYDNDPQMKEVMDNFNKQTQQRFHEYDERMKTTRQKCKEQCDEDIQKIILKDKLEKELMDKFATLHTDIQRVLAGIAEGALYAWKPEALKVAISAALKADAAKISTAGIEAGKKVVIARLEALNIAELKIAPWETYFAEGYSINVKELATVMFNRRKAVCNLGRSLDEATCDRIGINIGTMLSNGDPAAPGLDPVINVLNGIVERTKGAADAAAKTARETVTTGITEKETGVINTLFLSKQTAIIASIIAIVVIILVMKKKKNEEKTTIYKIIRRIDMMCLVYNQRNYYITPRHIQTTRLLCECELYMPNYDNDPEMKKVMQQFHDRTTQRFQEYDEKLQEKRQICKDTCDKEIQKIILKDKLEKELMDKFATLQTDIQNDAIPTCICEKSLADKTEKFCLNCGMNVGGGVTLSSGVLGGIGAVAVNAWKDAALEAAIAAANEAGIAAGKAAGEAKGMNVVIGSLKKYFFTETLGINSLDSFFTTKYYFDIEKLAKAIYDQRKAVCNLGSSLAGDTCDKIATKLGLILPNGQYAPPGPGPIVQGLNGLAGKAEQAAAHVTKTTSESVTAAIKARETALIEGRFESSITSINASIIAIIVIVLIMVIIYLILRYRRKKKMKKKLQYIKLLEE
ncbi:hypothetical protein PFFCH_00317 [Plasmodium falciparum FCH/4]|uniref:Surface antigen n=1 Tax=Plasmodium falciparum FCH/4 TaxID=1036724 RepID=A0A024VUX9_PLAFA|nr:hypothetical protein PFFCH_00317 [Plasmodium falciparum FCH/4]